MFDSVKAAFTGPSAAFLTVGLASVLMPLLIMVTSRGTNDYEGNQDNGDQNEDQNQQQQWNPCSWWQFSCKRQYRNYDENGNYNEQSQDENQTPWWFIWGDEEGRRDREEMGLPPRALLFVYIWSLVLFAAILFYGVKLLRQQQPLQSLVVALFMWANLAFVSLWYLGGLEGGIEIDGPEIEESGFYGQFPVMMFLTSFFWVIFAVAFGILFYRQESRRANVAPKEENAAATTQYQNMEAPEVQMTDKKPTTSLYSLFA